MMKMSKSILGGAFACVGVLSLVVSSLASASVPTQGRITDDTAIYQNLSEIRAHREHDLNVDSDIARLSALEGRYKEKLPALSRPIQRVKQQQYRNNSIPSRQAAPVRN